MAFWKNVTEGTDTPTNATNLSRAERYLAATAGANGDFYVDIDGADGLDTGDILRIAFPTATNSASNARLSIDGVGGTFRDCVNKFDNAEKAGHINQKNITLIYNGTKFEVQPYELRGTFVPTLVGTTTAGNHTYNQQVGYYTKIGEIVHFYIYMYVTTLGDWAGNAVIEELPFATDPSAFYLASFTVGWNTRTNFTETLGAYATNNSKRIALRRISVSAVGANVTTANITNDPFFFISGTYRTEE